MTDERLRWWQEQLRWLVAEKQRLKDRIKVIDEALAQTIAEFERELESANSK